MIDTYFYQHENTVTQFNGELIASVSSSLPSKDRWTEFCLFISEDDEWILQGVGRTKVEGEKDRYWSIVSDDPADILQSIMGNESSRLAKKLIAASFRHLADCVCEDD